MPFAAPPTGHLGATLLRILGGDVFSPAYDDPVMRRLWRNADHFQTLVDSRRVYMGFRCSLAHREKVAAP